MQLVAVGDAAKIEPILTKYGKVDVFDTTGTGVRGAQP
jgi:hypothetical protein